VFAYSSVSRQESHTADVRMRLEKSNIHMHGFQAALDYSGWRRLITVAGGDRCYSMTINSNKLEGRIKTLLVLTMLILHTQIASIMVALMSLQLQISRFQYA